MDKKEVLKNIKERFYYHFLRDLDKKYKADKEVVLAAVKVYGPELQYADHKLKADKEVVLIAVKQDGWALKYADKKLKADKEVVLIAVKKDGSALEYADKKLKADKEFVLAAVKQSGSALEHADKKLKADKEVVLEAVKQDGFVFQYADKKLQADKEFVLAAVKKDGFALECADKKLKADKEVVLIAVRLYGGTLEYADKKLQADKEVVLIAVKQDGLALKYADKKLLADKEVVLAAVKQDGWALKYADKKLLADKEVIKVAIKASGDAVLKYVGVNFKADEEGYKNFIKSENLEGKKLIKISVYLSKISEREDAWGTYTFEDGSTKEGGAYLNNVLSGTIDFPNQDGEVTFKDFIERLKDNEWTQYIDEFIDNFEGTGKSIDYDEDEFEDWSHHDTVDCDYDAKKNPSEIYFYFGDKKVTFNLNSDNLYVHQGVAYTRENIAELIQEFEKN